MKLLSVDDSRLVRMMISAAAEVLEMEFLEAASAIEALEILSNDSAVDLILLDWHMPGMTGYELLLRLKSEPQWQDIPVMMVTSEVDRRSVVQAIEAGASHYLMKPFSQDELVSRIMACMGWCA